jgi:hypothetical protein
MTFRVVLYLRPTGAMVGGSLVRGCWQKAASINYDSVLTRETKVLAGRLNERFIVESIEDGKRQMIIQTADIQTAEIEVRAS